MLHLKHADLRKATALQQLVLAPFDAEGPAEWCRAVGRAARDLCGGDTATFVLPLGTAPLGTDLDVHALGHAPAIQRYPEQYAAIEQRYGLVERSVRLRVVTRRRLYGRWDKAIRSSAYYNDYVIPLDAHDPLGISLRLPNSANAQFILHHRRRSRRFTRREYNLMWLLYSCFRAGVDAAFHGWQGGSPVSRMLDDLRTPALLFDGNGRLLHRTEAWSASLVGLLPSDGAELERAAAALVRAVGRPCGWNDPVREIGVGGLRWTLRASRTERLLPGARLTVLVILAPPGSDLSLDHVQNAFGLTRRQAEVARLLAGRYSNREIARILSISTHTVKRHAEQILLKLGVGSRAEVARIMSGGIVEPAGRLSARSEWTRFLTRGVRRS